MVPAVMQIAVSSHPNVLSYFCSLEIDAGSESPMSGGEVEFLDFSSDGNDSGRDTPTEKLSSKSRRASGVFANVTEGGSDEEWEFEQFMQFDNKCDNIVNDVTTLFVEVRPGQPLSCLIRSSCFVRV